VIQNYKQNQKKLQPLHTCSVWYWIPSTELQAAWKVCKLRRCPSKRPTQARKFITHVYARLWKGKGGLNTEGADRKGRLKKEDFEKSVTPSCLDDKAIYVKALLVTYLGDWRDWPPAWNDTYTMRCWWGRPARGKLHPHMDRPLAFAKHLPFSHFNTLFRYWWNSEVSRWFEIQG
jgi:hypothetical protein